MWLKNTKFNIDEETIVCPNCKTKNLYKEDRCKECGTSLNAEKLKIDDMLEYTNWDVEITEDKDGQIDRWIDKFQKYLYTEISEEREEKLIVEPIEMMMEQNGYYFIVDMLENSDKLVEYIFKAPQFAIPDKFILKIAQKGYEEEAIEYIELMAVKKKELPKFRKLVEDLAVFFAENKWLCEENENLPKSLITIASKINKNCKKFVSTVLLQYDSEYKTSTFNRSDFLKTRYRAILPMVKKCQYEPNQLIAFEMIMNELMAYNEKLLVSCWNELYSVAKENCDEVLAAFLGSLIYKYYKLYDYKKTDKFLSENPSLKKKIFSRYCSVPITFLKALFTSESCEKFHKYFVLAFHNSHFLSCRKNVIELFNCLGQAKIFDLNSKLVVKKAATILPYDYREEIDIPIWECKCDYEFIDEIEDDLDIDQLVSKYLLDDEEAPEFVESKELDEILEDEELRSEDISKYEEKEEPMDYDYMFMKYLNPQNQEESEELVSNSCDSFEDEIYEDDEEDFFAYIFYNMTASDKRKLGINEPLDKWLMKRGVNPYDEEQVRACLANSDNWQDEYYGFGSENEVENNILDEEDEEEDFFASVFYDITPEMKREMGIEGPLQDWLVEHGADEYDEEQVRACLADPDHWKDDFYFESSNSYDNLDDYDYGNSLYSDFDLDDDMDKDDYEQAIEDAEDYAYLASVSGRRSSYDDDDIALEMDETFEDYMMSRGLNPFDPDSYDDF